MRSKCLKTFKGRLLNQDNGPEVKRKGTKGRRHSGER